MTLTQYDVHARMSVLLQLPASHPINLMYVLQAALDYGVQWVPEADPLLGTTNVTHTGFFWDVCMKSFNCVGPHISAVMEHGHLRHVPAAPHFVLVLQSQRQGCCCF